MYEFGRFRFDPANHLLANGGTPVSLTPKAFEVLVVLVQNGRRLTTKEELMRKVWPDSFVEEANLTVNVSALRKALGESTTNQLYIETVPKKGYRFVAAVTETQEEADRNGHLPSKPVTKSSALSSLPAETGATAIDEDPPRFTGQKFGVRFVVVSLCLALTVAVAIVFIAFPSQTAKHAMTEPRRLAVLPFQNLRGDAETEFLGFALADAVISKLGYVSELTVRPSYSIQKYRTGRVDLQTAASQLGVDTLLIGTFLREEGDLRISCQLISVKTDSILWKGVFDLKYEKLLTVQDRLANQIVKELELTLSPSESARLSRGEAVSPLGYEFYLKGIDLYSAGDFATAVKMLEKSAELAPDYALTWAYLGKSYTASASFQFGGIQQYQKAQKAFERALALRSDQIDARIFMANMFTDTGRVEKAVPLLREGLKTNPNHAEIHWELGYAYRFGGMLRESVSESETARRLDPVVKLNSSVTNSYFYLGQYDRFLESLPTNRDSALIAFYRGLGEYYRMNLEESAKQFDRAVRLDHSLLHAQIGEALGLGIRHQPENGMAVLRSLETKINQRGVGDPEATYKIAQAYAVLGDEKSALRVLKQSIDKGFFPYPYFLADPLLDSLRQRREFYQLMSTARQRHEAFVKSFS